MVSTYHFVLWEVIFLANLCFCCFFPGQARISQVSHSNGEVESVELTDSEIHIISGGTILYVVNPEVNENLEILLLIDLSELPKGVALQVVLSLHNIICFWWCLSTYITFFWLYAETNFVIYYISGYSAELLFSRWYIPNQHFVWFYRWSSWFCFQGMLYVIVLCKTCVIWMLDMFGKCIWASVTPI